MLIAKTNYQASLIASNNTAITNKIDNNTMYIGLTSIFVCLFCLIYTLVKTKTKKDDQTEIQNQQIKQLIHLLKTEKQNAVHHQDIISIKNENDILRVKNQQNKQNIKQLLHQTSELKRSALKRYEHDIDRLIDQVKTTVDSFESTTKKDFLEELTTVNFAGFGQQEKIENFNKFRLQPILEKQLRNLQEELIRLGEQFYYVEENLDNEFSEILRDLKNNCRRLRIAEPDFNFSELEKKSTHEVLYLPTKSQKVAGLVGVTAVSCAAILGFFPSDALADTTTDASAHGVGHASAHGVGHAAGHGVGHAAGHAAGHGVGHVAVHGVGHAVGHAVGFAIPVLNVALIGFSAYRLCKFFFDDSEIKKELKNNTLNEISKYYRVIMYGKDSNLGLDGQLKCVKDEFRKSRQKLFDQSIQPTLESVLATLD